MKTLPPLLGIAAIVVVTFISGFVQGKLSNRWGVPADLEAAAQRFEKVPRAFGNWKFDREEEMPQRVVDTLECAGYFNGSFVNTLTGERVNMFIVLGPPGPISVHTPEVCYSSRDYDIKEKRRPLQIYSKAEGSPEDSFWAVTMRSTDVNADMLRVFYGWAVEDHWQCPESPRIEFGGRTYLFKMQLAAQLPPDTKLKVKDTCRDFLREFLPVLNPVLLDITS